MFQPPSKKKKGETKDRGENLSVPLLFISFFFIICSLSFSPFLTLWNALGRAGVGGGRPALDARALGGEPPSAVPRLVAKVVPSECLEASQTSPHLLLLFGERFSSSSSPPSLK